MNNPPRVFLLGAGPGDPELLTLKAARILRAADVVLHDSLIDPRILDLTSPQTKLIDVGKRCGRHLVSQSEISRLICEQALAGHSVVRLKGGDPMIFGRATEEIAAMNAQGISFEVVPGVTAAAAAAASLGASLTRRGVARSLHVLSGHGAEGWGAAGGLPAHDWVSLAKAGGTLAIYMGGHTVAGLTAHLIEAGMSPSIPAAAVENASLPDERVMRSTLASLPRAVTDAAGAGPVLLLIGEALGDLGTVQNLGVSPDGGPEGWGAPAACASD